MEKHEYQWRKIVDFFPFYGTKVQLKLKKKIDCRSVIVGASVGGIFLMCTVLFDVYCVRSGLFVLTGEQRRSFELYDLGSKLRRHRVGVARTIGRKEGDLLSRVSRLFVSRNVNYELWR